MFIIRRSNFTNSESGIVTLCKWPSGMQVEREISTCISDGHLQRMTIPDCVSTNSPPGDEHNVARNM